MLQSVLSRENFTVDSLFSWVAPAMLHAGWEFHTQGKVQLDFVQESVARLRVQDGSEGFTVTLVAQAGAFRDPIRFTCNCPSAIGHPFRPCPHKIAAVHAVQDYLRTQGASRWKTVLAGALAQTTPSPTRKARQLLVFSLQPWTGEWRFVPFTLPLSAFPEAIHGDRDALARQIPLLRKPQPLKSRAAHAGFHLAAPSQLQAANLLVVGGYQYSSPASAFLDVIIPALADALVFQGTAKQPLQQLLTIQTQPGRLALELLPGDDGLRLTTTMTIDGQTRTLAPGEVTVIAADQRWVLAGPLLVRVDADPALLTALLGEEEIVVPPLEVEEFSARFLAPLAEQVPVHGAVAQAWEEVTDEPAPRCYLREAEGTLQVELRFGYGAAEVSYESALPTRSVRRDDARNVLLRVHRQPRFEQLAWERLADYGLKRASVGETYVLRTGVHPVEFLTVYVSQLQRFGYEIYGEEALRTVRIVRDTPRLSLRVSSIIDWFDVDITVTMGELDVSVAELRRALRKKERFIKLPDGSTGELPVEWVEQYQYLFVMGEDTGHGVRMANAQLSLVDQLVEQADEVEIDAEFIRRRDHLRAFQQITPHALPQQEFHGVLRHYQEAGYHWLHFLHEYGFGGCLADDMGLGKTVQTLAFLQSLRESGHATHASLLVMPRSLLVNWQREAERFTPDLRVRIHADGDRETDPATFDECDLLLTTYGVMRRDLELLRQYQFHYIILDEAQVVKNPLAQTARASRLLRGDHRLALTGTPVENSTVELWSLFAFLNPGLLGTLEHFRAAFAGPIERHQSEPTSDFLRRLVYPFILRRRKEEVAPELPPRTERIIYCDMEPAQRRSYLRLRDTYRAQLLGLIEEEGMQGARMKVLEGLLRLRQICNHPRLVDNSFRGESAKFVALFETLETLQAEGHKALIFSQFTQMLKLIREVLDARGIPYAYLDGQTQDRQAQVDRFQLDDALPFFLISLKAGGVGLNLTAADYVIHVDPWWNPAVERQATDRTHRIGQEKPVMVYKLIARDSVEEKILQLQSQKQALVDTLISTESGLVKSLTRDDIAVLFS